MYHIRWVCTCTILADCRICDIFCTIFALTVIYVPYSLTIVYVPYSRFAGFGVGRVDRLEMMVTASSSRSTAIFSFVCEQKLLHNQIMLGKYIPKLLHNKIILGKCIPKLPHNKTVYGMVAQRIEMMVMASSFRSTAIFSFVCIHSDIVHRWALAQLKCQHFFHQDSFEFISTYFDIANIILLCSTCGCPKDRDDGDG